MISIDAAFYDDGSGPVVVERALIGKSRTYFGSTRTQLSHLLQAEAKALLPAAKIAREKNWSRILLLTDCK